MKGCIGKLFSFVCVSASIVIAVIYFLPSKYLAVEIDKKALEPESVPGAQTVVFYDVFARTESELQAELKQKGQEQLGGFAVTQYSISYRFAKVNPDTPECAIADVDVSYTAKVVFPRWVNIHEGPLALVWWFQNMMTIAIPHEADHVQIIIDNLPAVREAIEKGTCENAAGKAEAEIDHIQDLEEDYDRKFYEQHQLPSPTSH